ncbi:MAG: UDP-glucose/GDP-mannose dehydrogenase family protein [Candidatus Bathyarchaeia archaeon]
MFIESISVIGLGFVGLATSVSFADRGFRVYAVDQDKGKVVSVKAGRTPFYEPGVEPLIQKGLDSGLLRCVDSVEEAVLSSDVTFIAVGTPSRPDGSIDLTYVKQSAVEIGAALLKKADYHLVTVKSTVVPGTTRNLVKPALEAASGKVAGVGFGLAMSPEFFKEGSALHDTFNPDRVVIGEYDAKSGNILEDIFRRFYCERQPPILRMSLESAEMVKYASNALLAAKISFINEIANICELLPGVDVAEVAKGVGLDQRIGANFLNAGLGFGGSCFPKDLRALISFSQTLNYEPDILKAVLKVNDSQPLRGIEIARNLLGDLKGRRVALLGLSFKPGTSDIREAASLKIISRLLEEGSEVVGYDPVAIPEVKVVLGDKIRYASSALEAINDAECCIIVTEWEEFKRLRPEDFKARMRRPVIVDGRKIYNPAEFRGKLTYAAIGLGPK